MAGEVRAGLLEGERQSSQRLRQLSGLGLLSSVSLAALQEELGRLVQRQNLDLQRTRSRQIRPPGPGRHQHVAADVGWQQIPDGVGIVGVVEHHEPARLPGKVAAEGRCRLVDGRLAPNQIQGDGETRVVCLQALG